jgi:hypothetical protein
MPSSPPVPPSPFPSPLVLTAREERGSDADQNDDRVSTDTKNTTQGWLCRRDRSQVPTTTLPPILVGGGDYWGQSQSVPARRTDGVVLGLLPSRDEGIHTRSTEEAYKKHTRSTQFLRFNLGFSCIDRHDGDQLTIQESASEQDLCSPGRLRGGRPFVWKSNIAGDGWLLYEVPLISVTSCHIQLYPHLSSYTRSPSMATGHTRSSPSRHCPVPGKQA